MVSIVINLQVNLKTWTVIVRTKQIISLYSLHFYIIGFHLWTPAIPNHIIRPVSRRAYKNQPIRELYVCDAIIKEARKLRLRFYQRFHWLTISSSEHDQIFTKLGHMIPLWKGKNPIYFEVIRSKVKVTITINRIFDNRIHNMARLETGVSKEISSLR
jgi:hypothetical protein